MTHSAEWLRGAVWALRRLKPEVWDEPQEALSMRDLRWCVDDDYQKAVKLLAAAEARDDNPTIDEHINAAVNDLYRKYGPRLDLFFADVEAYKPAAWEAKQK